MILVNGKSENTIPVSDRGLQYGDGLFETLAIKQGRPLCWAQHLERLREGVKKLNLPNPDYSVLEEECHAVCHEVEKGVLKIILTRGQGERGYALPDQPLPTRIISRSPWPEYPDSYYKQGINVVVCEYKMGVNPALSGIKHLNRLDQVMARAEWHTTDYAEGIIRDINNHVVEGTMSNLFMIKDSQLFTPDLTRAGVEGVIRNLILSHVSEIEMTANIVSMEMSDLLSADEVFMCNSIIGIWPVKQIQGHAFSVFNRTKRIRDYMIANEWIMA